MKKLLYISLFLLFLFSGAAENFAQCTCAEKYKNITPSKELEFTDALFVGKVIEIKKTERDKSNSYTETVKFEVKRAWKSDLEEVVTVVNKIQGCLNGFEENKEWLVYAYKNKNGTFSTACCCSRTKLLSRAEEDLKEFEKNNEKEMKISKNAKVQ